MLIKIDLIKKVMDDIAPKYFDADEITDITKSRLGIFAVISETMGTLLENTTINNAIKAKERLSITSSRSTLIQEAASYPELTLPQAIPSKLGMFLGIPVKYLEDKHMVNSSLIEFILDADTNISISEVNFMLDYSIKITGRLVGDSFVYGAQYIITRENPLSIVRNPFLITTMRMINGEQYLMVNIILSQKTKQYTFYNLIETDQIDLNGIDFSYDNKLVNFNVFYKGAGGNSYDMIEKINHFSKLVSESRFVYFDDSIEGNIRLFIPNSFNIAFNSEIRLDIYTTLGAKGSFSYNSGVIEIIPSSFEDTLDYSGSYFQSIITSDSVGGTNGLTTQEIRDVVINYKSSLRGVDTENDLNSFFREIDKINNINFIKKRIDIFEKQYTAFMVMRDKSNVIIPTNTLDMYIAEADINHHYVQTERRVIKPNTAYSLKTDEDFIVSKNGGTLTDLFISTTEEDVTKFLFGTPYLIVINESPPSVSYYLNSVDKFNNMGIEYSTEDVALQFIVNRINVRRNAIIGESAYTISANIIPASELPEGIVDPDTGTILDDTKIKVYGYVYSEEFTDSVTGYFPITISEYSVDDDLFIASGELTTDEYITLDNKLRIVDSIMASEASVTSDYIINIDNVKIGIAVYYKEDGFTNKGSYSDIIPNFGTHGLLNVYTNNLDRATLMIDMSKMIKSVVTFNDEGNDVISFSLNQVPLVRYSQLKNQISRISEIIDNTNATISAMLDIIRNNSSIDYKFYATYGKSRYFTLENTENKLDKLNISLEFKVRVSSSNTDTALVSDIKAFIQPLVEAINVLDTNSSIYFSNIVTQVENEFRYSQNRMLSFELTKVNTYSTLYQSIVNTTKPLYTMAKAELLEYVAEFIKLDIDKITIVVVPV